MYGDMTLLNEAPFVPMRKTRIGSGLDSTTAQTSNGTHLVGVGIDPEGIDNNPVYYSLLIDAAWRDQPVVLSKFFDTWAVKRCGMPPPTRVPGDTSSTGQSTVQQAWGLLSQTVYAHSPEQTYEHHMHYCPTIMPGTPAASTHDGLGSLWLHAN